MSETTLIFALTIVLFIIVAFTFYQKCFEHVDALLWENTKTYVGLIEKYGLPTVLDHEKGGGAMWNISQQRLNYFDKKGTNGNNSVEDPAVHLWSPIKLFPAVNTENVKPSAHIQHKRISDIMDILPNYISYDPVSHQVMARFYSLPIAQTLTMLAMKITTEELTIDEIKNDGLLLKHASKVTPGTSEYDPVLAKKTENYIQQYIACFA
jgi:hypothetical protein